jgi:hypothetical protein
MTSVLIDGVTYYVAAEICRDLGVARQTLWRWRDARKIPAGHRYRGYQILFTEEEVVTIRQYANRLEPAESKSGIRAKRQSSRRRSRR